MSRTTFSHSSYVNFVFFLPATSSFAQQRIFLHEQIPFASQDHQNIYLIPLIFRIACVNEHLSISRLYQGLRAMMQKHHILRTALTFDSENMIMQHCMDISDIADDRSASEYPLTRHQYNHQYDIENTMNDILSHANRFDLSKGRVIQCHVLHHTRSSDHPFVEHADVLSNDDLILFCIHHSAFDGASTAIFCQELTQAYDSDSILSTNTDQLQYIDYAVHEHQLNMTSSQTFWRLQLQQYNLQRVLSLPSDRRRSSAEQRSVRASSAQFTLDNDLSSAFFTYASAHQLTPFQLGLAAFYIFLFKLSHGQSDLCISCINANRYRSELENMIGMFVATLPYRMQLQPHWPFDELVKHVRDKSLSILEHSQYPLQHILSDFHENQMSASFLEIVFDFITASPNTSQLSLDGTTLKPVSLSSSSEVAKFDFLCSFIYDPMVDDGQLSCRFVCSRDLYDERTVETMSQRFQHLLHQLFSPRLTTIVSDQNNVSISRLSLILPDESEEIEGRVFHRLADVINEGMSYFTRMSEEVLEL